MNTSWTHFRLDRRHPGYWRVTFDHPPINTITATTITELSQLMDLIERDAQLKVVVFDSANPDFFLAHYDIEKDPAKSSVARAPAKRTWNSRRRVSDLVARFGSVARFG